MGNQGLMGNAFVFAWGANPIANAVLLGSFFPIAASLQPTI
jgi:hypothetical protein